MMSTQRRSMLCRIAVVAIALGIIAMPRPASGSTEPWGIDPEWSSPAPDEARVLAADGSGVIAVGRGGEVQSLDTSGRQQWGNDLGQVTTIDPVAVDANLVVVPVNYETFVALDRATGAPRWTHRAPRAHEASIGVDASAHLIVATISSTGRLELLDGSTGAVRWSAVLPPDDDTFAQRSWIVASRVVAAWGGASALHIRAFDAVDGRLVWSRDAAKTSTLPAVNSSSVVLAENTKFIGKRRVIARVRSLDVNTGTERWSRRVRGPFWPHFETAADDVDVAVVGEEGRVTLLDAATGRVRWRQATKRLQLEVSPRLFGEVVAITTYGTGLAALARADGSLLANSQPGPVQYSVTIEASAAAGDRLYLLVQGSEGQAQVWALGPLVASS